MAPSPQHGTRVRASSAAARKAARSGGDNGPARREISASGSRSLIVDIDSPAWNKLAVFKVSFLASGTRPAAPGGPPLFRAVLDFHATDGYTELALTEGARVRGRLLRQRRLPRGSTPLGRQHQRRAPETHVEALIDHGP